MNKNLDLRVRRTYSCLFNAMLDLLKEKSLEDITVNELCDRAIVGRGTFYKHFSDKYDFFSFVLGEMFEHYLEEAERNIDNCDPRSYYVAFFRAYIQFVETNREYFGTLTSSSMTSVMLFSTSDALSQKLETQFRKNIEEGYSLCITPTAAARFLTGAMAQSARYLIEHREEPSKEDFVANMNILIAKVFEENETLISKSNIVKEKYDGQD